MIQLTDEEIYKVLKLGIPYPEVEGRTIAKAQLKKVVEWLESHSHNPRHGFSGRKILDGDWQALLEEIKGEVAK